MVELHGLLSDPPGVFLAVAVIVIAVADPVEPGAVDRIAPHVLEGTVAAAVHGDLGVAVEITAEGPVRLAADLDAMIAHAGDVGGLVGVNRWRRRRARAVGDFGQRAARPPRLMPAVQGRDLDVGIHQVASGHRSIVSHVNDPRRPVGGSNQARTAIEHAFAPSQPLEWGPLATGERCDLADPGTADRGLAVAGSAVVVAMAEREPDPARAVAGQPGEADSSCDRLPEPARPGRAPPAAACRRGNGPARCWPRRGHCREQGRACPSLCPSCPFALRRRSRRARADRRSRSAALRRARSRPPRRAGPARPGATGCARRRRNCPPDTCRRPRGGFPTCRPPARGTTHWPSWRSRSRGGCCRRPGRARCRPDLRPTLARPSRRGHRARWRERGRRRCWGWS